MALTGWPMSTKGTAGSPPVAAGQHLHWIGPLLDVSMADDGRAILGIPNGLASMPGTAVPMGHGW